MKLSIASATSAVLLLALPRGAHSVEYADCYITANCFHDGVDNTDTDDNVVAYFYHINGNWMGTKNLANEDNCSWWRPNAFGFITLPAYQVRSVTLEASGDDAFLADYVEFTEYRDGRDQFSKWGQDNGGGYCLSTDSNDNFGSVARNCYRCLQFHLNGKVYVPSRCPNGQLNHSRRSLRNSTDVEHDGDEEYELEGTIYKYKELNKDVPAGQGDEEYELEGTTYNYKELNKDVPGHGEEEYVLEGTAYKYEELNKDVPGHGGLKGTPGHSGHD